MRLPRVTTRAVIRAALALFLTSSAAAAEPVVTAPSSEARDPIDAQRPALFPPKARSTLHSWCENCDVADGPFVPVYPHDYGDGQGTRLTPFKDTRHVFTKRDLVDHVEAHRERIWILAKEIIRQNPDRYRHLPLPRLLRAVKAAAFDHDAMKITGDRKLLREFGFGGNRETGQRPRTVASHLVELWGKRVSTENGLDPKLGRVLKQMNLGDKRFEARHMPEAVEIVNFADKIDKGMDPLTKFEELGRVAVLPSRYYSNPKNTAYNPGFARMAKGVEERYYEIIPKSLESLAYREAARAARVAGRNMQSDARARPTRILHPARDEAISTHVTHGRPTTVEALPRDSRGLHPENAAIRQRISGLSVKSHTVSPRNVGQRPPPNVAPPGRQPRPRFVPRPTRLPESGARPR